MFIFNLVNCLWNGYLLVRNYVMEIYWVSGPLSPKLLGWQIRNRNEERECKNSPYGVSQLRLLHNMKMYRPLSESERVTLTWGAIVWTPIDSWRRINQNDTSFSLNMNHPTTRPLFGSIIDHSVSLLVFQKSPKASKSHVHR